MTAQETLRLAFQHFEREDYPSAEQALLGLLQQAPEHVQALHLLGSVAAAQGRFAEAALVLQRGLAVAGASAPETLAMRYKLGRAFYESDRAEDAFLVYRGLLDNGHQHPEIFVAAAAALQAMAPSGNNDAQALDLLEAALRRQPDNAATWHRKALLQARRKQFDAARQSLQQVLRLDGQQAQYWLDAGLLEHAQGHYQDALPYFDQALIIDHHCVDAHVSRGTSLARLRDYDEAIDSYRRALRMDPDDADAKLNLALSLLVLGQFAEALPLYEWRWEGRGADPYRHEAIPAWNGTTSLRGKRILLWAEQGHGDTIQFCRYVALMAEAGAEVVLEVPLALQALVHSLPVAAQLTIIAAGDPVPEVDVQLPLMSLPLVCNTELKAIPAPVPYLAADPARASSWEPRVASLVAPGRRLRVGVVVSGNAGNANDARRSIALAQLAPLAQARNDVDFFVVQPDLRADDAAWLQGQVRWHGLGEWITDFADTAAAVSCMDLVISVDTAAAHLSGALGKPVWIVLPYAPDWRWFLNRHDSPWYPTARLFRQQQAGQWGDVVLAVKAGLAVADAQSLLPGASSK